MDRIEKLEMEVKVLRNVIKNIAKKLGIDPEFDKMNFIPEKKNEPIKKIFSLLIVLNIWMLIDMEMVVRPIHTSLIKKKKDMWMMKESSMRKHISLHLTLLKML